MTLSRLALLQATASTRSQRLCFAARGFHTSVLRRNDTTSVPRRTRNIGIIAHIDAGKTTTTERMLYYSGFTRRLGDFLPASIRLSHTYHSPSDVDEGSTVTDFLPAERARGITIQSAAITFSWPPAGPEAPESSTSTPARLSSHSHSINLIDTPGHADFTFEVLRSLRILDGAVCILDGVAGVEAQTEQVWRQANHYDIPRLVFVNKLDRDGAAFARTVREVGTRLGVWPAVCQIPWWREADSKLQGVGDVIGMRALLYSEGGDGKAMQVFDLASLHEYHGEFAAELGRARVALVELLSEHDDDMVEKFLEAEEDHLAISEVDIVNSLRKLTCAKPQPITPLFSGASFRNIGVQPLLDAVVDLLPAPEERPDPDTKIGDRHMGLNQLLSGSVNLQPPPSKKPGKGRAVQPNKATMSLKNVETCALAFKVVNDAKRGVLVYVRVYSGRIGRNTSLFNTNLNVTERPSRTLRMYANQAVDVESIAAGQIGVLPGLKFARTGDTLMAYTGANPKVGPPPPLNSLQLRPIAVPPPVFFASVEPNSLSEEKHLQDQLALLLREDPSLHVAQDPDSGQTHLSGMGELHLEIARDRLIQDLKAKARIGNIQIGYRETITNTSSQQEAIFDRDIAGKSAKAGSTAVVANVSDVDPRPDQIELDDNNVLSLSFPDLDDDGTPLAEDGRSLPENLPIEVVRSALQSGVSAALGRGPSFSFSMHSTHISLTFDITNHLFDSTTPAALSSAARLATTRALKDAASLSGAVLMEPVMIVTISVDAPSLGAVVHDISSARGGQIISLDGEDDDLAYDAIDPKRIYTPPDPFGGSGSGVEGLGEMKGMRQITARVPLKEMVGYLKHLRSLTAGRGTFVMRVDQFERMNAQRMKIVVGEMRGSFE
ncbi:P-loop containing nucleoside triphosphate hydrolase protein [Myriangium duriaei CBS 260.36]|uniref:Ribosome-releasing factor 2, mitochondrial n=1 Tax=Myriangium duriaei CBS 260.36 TaxID=1168546 RepID=A0A9P4MI06_9PEZI|nr:P-loop containing nucleoside triphosphate hydrolase protein [Myriangium duriaei CBS 260.36]